VDDKKIRRDACRRNDRPAEPEAADRPAVGAAAREGADDRMRRRAYSKRGSPMMLGGEGVSEESINRFLILNVLSGLADDDISGPTVCSPVSLSLSLSLSHSITITTRPNSTPLLDFSVVVP